MPLKFSPPTGAAYQLSRSFSSHVVLKRSLSTGWVVHHLNGDKADNRIENLFAVSQEGHRHTSRVAEPYIVRIRELEAQIEISP